jgi:hypothetical protein
MLSHRWKFSLMLAVILISLLAAVYSTQSWTSIPVVNDPLVRMPGTQPNQVALESPTRCLNCHANYNSEVEPGFNWKGSMMAQAARDFLFWACMTVAGQDSIWALGRPNAVDLCERCHFPEGWLEGRSDPPNASTMTGADFDGVQCDLCHRMYDPFFATTYGGSREGNDWLNYWDETNAGSTPSQPAADATYGEDMTQAQSIVRFDGLPFFQNNFPFSPSYTENGSGQYFVSSNSAKRASFADAAARHQTFYSRYHKSKYFCNACHDVSNPVLANLNSSSTQPLPTELNSASSYFHVERTFSEFMLSDYGKQGGAPTNAEFQAQGAPGITHASKCQDCHMRDVRGVAANKNGVLIRPDESIEHPQSGQPLHDMTGGNVWVSTVLASAMAGSPNYDTFNDQQLNQGAPVLTLDLTKGEGINPVALLAGADRARQQLRLAATIKNLTYDTATGALAFQVQNNSGHKLISGFPEGRRMFVNIKAYKGASLIYEVNPFDAAAGTLKGLDYPYQQGWGLPDPQPLGPNEVYVDALVYEMKPSSNDLTGETKTFHFALATGRYKDNRIPPKGFDINQAAGRLSVPVWHGVEDPNYFTPQEYTGGYDAVSLTMPSGADRVEAALYYQTTSREYIEFLRDEINGTDNLTLSSPTPSGETQAYIVQTDPFFSQLKAWGNTIWALWLHNQNVDGAKPLLMTQASTGVSPACGVAAPSLNSATPGHTQVVLDWSAAVGATGYKAYYDQAGKAQLLIDASNTTNYTDTGLTNGQEYCYKVTAYDSSCESSYSSILCAIPTNQGQANSSSGVSSIETGIYTGKGKVKTYSPKTNFNASDGVVIRALVIDKSTGLPLANATVSMLVTGPESLTLTSGPSDASGIAEATWQTKAPGRKSPGTTAGSYTVETKGVALSGYDWDSVTTSTTFIVQ